MIFEDKDDDDVVIKRHNLINVCQMSVAFALLFAGYNTLQGYVSTTLPSNLGFLSLTILYSSYLLFLTIASFVCETLGDRKGMVFGATLYILFMASLITGNAVVILLASVLIGLGAAVLWVGQGNFQNESSVDENRGFLAGIFWSCLQASSILGPLTSYFILSDAPGNRNTVMYITFSCMGVAAVVLLFFLRRPRIQRQNWMVEVGEDEKEPLVLPADLSDRDSDNNNSNNHDKSLWRKILAPIQRAAVLCTTRDVFLIMFGCMFTGLEMSFSNGEFFKLTGLAPCYQMTEQDACLSKNCLWDNEGLTCAKHSSVISLVFISFGFGDCIGAIILGKFSDGGSSIRRKIVVILGGLAYASALAITLHIKDISFEESPIFPPNMGQGKSVSFLCYVAGVLYGITDAAWNTQIYAALGTLYPNEGRVLFTLYQVFQQIGGILGFGLPMTLSLENSNGPIWFQLAFMVLSVGTFMFVRIPNPK